MKVRLKPTETLHSIQTEDRILDSTIIEAIYQIRILKALAASLLNGYIVVTKENNGAVFSEEFDIWLHHYEHID